MKYEEQILAKTIFEDPMQNLLKSSRQIAAKLEAT